jgi:hypothetical protein
VACVLSLNVTPCHTRHQLLKGIQVCVTNLLWFSHMMKTKWQNVDCKPI